MEDRRGNDSNGSGRANERKYIYFHVQNVQTVVLSHCSIYGPMGKSTVCILWSIEDDRCCRRHPYITSIQAFRPPLYALSDNTFWIHYIYINCSGQSLTHILHSFSLFRGKSLLRQSDTLVRPENSGLCQNEQMEAVPGRMRPMPTDTKRWRDERKHTSLYK